MSVLYDDLLISFPLVAVSIPSSSHSPVITIIAVVVVGVALLVMISVIVLLVRCYLHRKIHHMDAMEEFIYEGSESPPSLKKVDAANRNSTVKSSSSVPARLGEANLSKEELALVEEENRQLQSFPRPKRKDRLKARAGRVETGSTQQRTVAFEMGPWS